MTFVDRGTLETNIEGKDYVIKEKELPWLAQFDTEIIANVAGATEEDYVEDCFEDSEV